MNDGSRCCQAGASHDTPPLPGRLRRPPPSRDIGGSGPEPDDLWCWAIGAGGRRVVLDSAWRDQWPTVELWSLIGQHGRLADHSAAGPIQPYRAAPLAVAVSSTRRHPAASRTRSSPSTTYVA